MVLTWLLNIQDVLRQIGNCLYMFVIHMLCFDSQQLMATYTFTLMMDPISPSLQLMPKAILITLYNYEWPRCYVITKVHVLFRDMEFIHHWSPPATFEARICRCFSLNLCASGLRRQQINVSVCWHGTCCYSPLFHISFVAARAIPIQVVVWNGSSMVLD